MELPATKVEPPSPNQVHIMDRVESTFSLEFGGRSNLRGN